MDCGFASSVVIDLAGEGGADSLSIEAGPGVGADARFGAGEAGGRGTASMVGDGGAGLLGETGSAELAPISAVSLDEPTAAAFVGRGSADDCSECLPSSSLAPFSISTTKSCQAYQ